MNDQAILEQIALNPKCRAVQLADRLDRDLDDVQGQLAGLIVVGDVIASNGTSPAGTPCQLYDLSDAFKESDAYKPILVKTLAAQFAAFRPDLGKTDRAIEFVRERGTATSSELHAVLQLDPREAPSQFLVNAVRNGRLVKDGKHWTLGPNAPEAIPATREPPELAVSTSPTLRVCEKLRRAAQSMPDALESGAELGKREPLEVPRFADRDATEPLQQLKQVLREPAPVVVPRFRFAIWSDGQVEIQRNGMQLAQLPREVADDFARFMTGGA